MASVKDGTEGHDYSSCPRFDSECNKLTEDDVARIAKATVELNQAATAHMAVELATKEFYQGVGKAVTKKFLTILGVIVVTIYLYIQDSSSLLK